MSSKIAPALKKLHGNPIKTVELENFQVLFWSSPVHCRPPNKIFWAHKLEMEYLQNAPTYMLN